MNEADTRAELIDKKLESAGWITNAENEVKVSREFIINYGEILPSGGRKRQLKADYVLEYKNTKLAVVEAKSSEVDVSEGVAQAKYYAQKLQLSTSFATNGEKIYEINHTKNTEGKIDAFPTPEELWNRTYEDGNEWLSKFNNLPFEDFGGTRTPYYYQEIAIRSAIEAIANNKHRVLLTLATGTGKTYIAFQIAWKLFKSRWTLQRDGKRQPRILFLTDRNILANQAYLEFSPFEEGALVRITPEDITKRGGVPKNGSVFFTIYQSFMSGQNDKPYFGEYEPDFFDLVIIDECHRGSAKDESSWRGILDYFSDAVHLGLTATPKNDDNVNTYKYFGEPVYIYSLKEGIQDGFLTPFRVKRIQTTIDEYIYTSDDEVIEGIVDEGRVYAETDFNKVIEIKEREKKRAEELLTTIKSDEKTLIFCANQAHAALVRDLINQISKGTSVDYCVRVTSNDGKIGDTHLNNFKDNDKTIPTILTTSQKLTTGVDARNVRNIVLMRPIYSMIEFKQIIGRGTRLFDGKYYFTIIDFVNAYRNFFDPEWDSEPIEYEGIEVDIESDNTGPKAIGTKSSTPKTMLRIRLSDGKVREIQSMSSTYFNIGGKQIGVEEFLKYLFNVLKLPKLFDSEEKLRKLWASPMTRRELLKELEEKGCYKDDLENLQNLIEPQDSDLFDVLQYIVYAKSPISRATRVETNKSNILNMVNPDQREFVAYVLRNYENGGIDELDDSKLSKVLLAKFGNLEAAEQKLGTPDEIRQMFIELQEALYKEVV